VNEPVQLRCPPCGSALPTAPERRVFGCSACGATSTLPVAEIASGLVELRRMMLAPRGGWPADGPIVMLPLWIVPIRRASLDALAAAALPAEIRIPAIGVGRMSALVSHAVNLSRVPVSASSLPPDGFVGEPAELSIADAFEIAELTALSLATGWPPAGEEDRIEVPFGPPTLVDLPCRPTATELVDLVFGLAAPRVLAGDSGLPDRGPELRRRLPVP
jgi:hypothetical protein